MLLLSCVSLLVLLGAAPTHARNCDPDLGFATRRSDGSGNFSRGTPTINNEYTYTTVIPDTQMTMVIFIITHSVMEKRDIMMTLNLANEQVVEKDQNKPLPNEYYWKLKVRVSSVISHWWTSKPRTPSTIYTPFGFETWRKEATRSNVKL